MIRIALTQNISSELKTAMENWLVNENIGEGTRERADILESLLLKEKTGNPLLEELYENKNLFVKRSHWIFGGDGWAYDIGFGGVDHG